MQLLSMNFAQHNLQVVHVAALAPPDTHLLKGTCNIMAIKEMHQCDVWLACTHLAT